MSAAPTSRPLATRTGAALPLVLALMLMLVGASPRSAAAQRTLSGTVLLLDRPGTPRDEVRTSIVWLSGGPSTPGARDTVPRRASIAMRGREFIPRVQVVHAGGAVGFPNQDPFSHNVFSNTDAASFDLGLYRRGSTRTAEFPVPGVHPVYCNIHVRMVSFVIAVPTRHVAGISPDGRFTFGDVAPGRYRLHVWHERAPMTVQEVTVGDADAVVRVTLDARGHVSGTHLNKFGLPYALTRADRYE